MAVSKETVALGGDLNGHVGDYEHGYEEVPHRVGMVMEHEILMAKEYLNLEMDYTWSYATLFN